MRLWTTKAAALTPILGMIAAAATYGNSAQAAGNALIVLDRSGSMVQDAMCTDGTMGPRKWDCAIREALLYVNTIENAGDPTALHDTSWYIWKFAAFPADPESQYMNPATAPLGPFTFTSDPTGEQDIRKQLNDQIAQGPTWSDANTPLAGAYCKGLRWLLDSRLAPPIDLTKPLYLKLESDGLENWTPSAWECYSATDSVGHPYDQTFPIVQQKIGDVWYASGLIQGSWQANMLDYALTGATHTPGDSAAFIRMSDYVQTDVSFLSEFIGGPPEARALKAMLTVGEPAKAALTRAATALTVSSADEFVQLLKGVASATGGRFSSFGSGVALPAGDPAAVHAVTGDANDDGCVDLADYNLVKQYYGQAVSSAQPLTYPTDVNRDGSIDVRDYRVLKTSWGTGCATAPAPIPVLPQTIFGFEDYSKWSSPQTTLTNVSRPNTEGQFALVVGGRNWREVSSVPFATSGFQGVTSKIAYDVYIPTVQSNPSWLGQTLLQVNCPSAGIYNRTIGTVEFAGKPVGKYATATFTLPANVKNAMQTPHADFSFKITINSNDPGYQLDNIRFVP